MHLLLAMSLMVTAPEPSADDVRILVMGWAVGGEIDRSRPVLDALLEEAIVPYVGTQRVVSVRDVEALFELEQTKDLIGCDDVACSAEIGLALNADVVVMGSIGRIGDTMHLSLKLIDSRTARTLHRVAGSTRRTSQLPTLIRRSVTWLLGPEDARAGASRPKRSTLARRHEVQRGRVTQRWVTIDREPPVPFRLQR